MTITKERTLAYHRSGKIGIELTQPCATQYDLSLAYTPGVAIPCEAIDEGEVRLESFDINAYREHLRCLIYGCTDATELSMQN